MPLHLSRCGIQRTRPAARCWVYSMSVFWWILQRYSSVSPKSQMIKYQLHSPHSFFALFFLHSLFWPSSCGNWNWGGGLDITLTFRGSGSHPFPHLPIQQSTSGLTIHTVQPPPPLHLINPLCHRYHSLPHCQSEPWQRDVKMMNGFFRTGNDGWRDTLPSLISTLIFHSPFSACCPGLALTRQPAFAKNPIKIPHTKSRHKNIAGRGVPRSNATEEPHWFPEEPFQCHTVKYEDMYSYENNDECKKVLV